MSKLAIIENDTITNIILGSVQNFPDLLDVTALGYGIGWIKSGEIFEAPPFVAPVQQYSTRMTTGQIIALFKDPSLPTKTSYARIIRAAQPPGNSPNLGDNIALEFLEKIKHPPGTDGLTDAADIEADLDYFLATPQNYIDQADKDRVMQGWPA